MDTIRIDLLPPEIKTWVIVLMAVFFASLYLVMRVVIKRFASKAPRVSVLPRLLFAFMAAWCFLQALGRFAVYGCSWPIWFAALIMGGCVELSLISFEFEKRAVSPGIGRAIMLMRAAAIAIVALILMQPVLIRYTGKKITRRVAVVVDESTSMRFVDRQWQPLETLGFAVRAGILPAETLAQVTSNKLDAAEVWKGLEQSQRDSVLDLCSTTRLSLACSLLSKPDHAGLCTP